MSHNIRYFTYQESVNPQDVKKELDSFVAHEDYQEGCTGLYHDIRWINSVICEDEESAQEMIEQNDRGDYDNVAVRFYDYDIRKLMSPEYEELNKKVDEVYRHLNQLQNVCYPQTYVAQFISCKKCGSRIARRYIKSNFCPVCRGDMRPAHILNKIGAAERKWKAALKQRGEYAEKNCKRVIKWLVKIEYHT